MKEYVVKVVVTESGYYEIKANSKEEAIEKAEEAFMNGDTVWRDDYSPYDSVKLSCEGKEIEI